MNARQTYGFALLLVISLAVVFSLILTQTDILNFTESQDDELLQLTKRQEVAEELQALKLKKLLKNNRDLILRKENFTQLSTYQQYVTPTNPIVTSYLATEGITTPQEAYATAIDWIWVADEVLHGVPEQWLLPAAFIADTPTDPDNPVPGSMVSDCESQAYTLVSLLEALTITKENVRVVVGEVNFSGETGGHAWVQLYVEGDWIELEATSGPFWDDENNVLVENNGFPYTFFKTRPYPVVEYWAFFNDRYYYNPDTGQKSADLPVHWLMTLSAPP